MNSFSLIVFTIMAVLGLVVADPIALHAGLKQSQPIQKEHVVELPLQKQVLPTEQKQLPPKIEAAKPVQQLPLQDDGMQNILNIYCVCVTCHMPTHIVLCCILYYLGYNQDTILPAKTEYHYTTKKQRIQTKQEKQMLQPVYIPQPMRRVCIELMTEFHTIPY